jgi:hypothetical protein
MPRETLVEFLASTPAISKQAEPGSFAPPQDASKFATILLQEAEHLYTLDRYERRALSRRTRTAVFRCLGLPILIETGSSFNGHCCFRATVCAPEL